MNSDRRRADAVAVVAGGTRTFARLHVVCARNVRVCFDCLVRAATVAAKVASNRPRVFIGF